jgi:hypothetical protein
MERFIPVVTSQDQSVDFKEMVVDVINRSQPKASLVAGAGAAGKKPPDGMSIVAFVSTTTVSTKAVNMALFLARCCTPFSSRNSRFFILMRFMLKYLRHLRL